jgi:LysM repeat protein
MDLYGISVRQPAPGDIIGDKLKIAALGTAFEASYEWRLVASGEVLAQGYLQAGSMGTMETFIHESAVEGIREAGAAVFEFNGDDPSGGEEGAAPEPVRVPVIVIPGASGYVPHQVQQGETLAKIVKDLGYGDVSTVANAALASGLKDPNKIRPGQILRIPV